MAQLELLSVLAEHPGARPSELAQLLHLRPNTVTTILNVLAEQGMITRSAADEDRRAITLNVTTPGTQALNTWQATNAAVLHLALSALPARQGTLLANAVPAINALVQAI